MFVVVEETTENELCKLVMYKLQCRTLSINPISPFMACATLRPLYVGEIGTRWNNWNAVIISIENTRHMVIISNEHVTAQLDMKRMREMDS